MKLLFQFNIAKMRKPYSDPLFDDFKRWLNALHALADIQPGFVWRYHGEKDSDGYIKADPSDPLIMGNISAWRDYDSLVSYTFTDGHLQIMKMKRRWFEPIPHPWTVLWWGDDEDLNKGPDEILKIAQQKLKHLEQNGTTAEAFGFGHHKGSV